MNRLLFLLVLAVLAGCASTEPAMQPTALPDTPAATATPDPVAAFDYDALTYPELGAFEVPQPQRVDLPNGMTVFLIEDRDLPLIGATARIGVGSLWEPADHVGLADVTGDVLRTGGIEGVPADELNQRLEDLGASVETSIGEQAGFASMSTLAETIDEVLPLFAGVLMRPTFAEDKVELAKTQFKSGIARRNDDPQGVAQREFFELLYGADSPYARSPEYYTVDNISRDDVVGFYERYFVPNNVYLSVYGDFDAAAMAEKVQAAFADWAADPGFERPEPPPVTQELDRAVAYVPKEDVTQSYLYFGHLGEITQDHPDYFPVVVMNQVLSGGFGSRLFRTIRTDLGLAYAVFGAYTASYNRPGPFYAGTFTQTERTVEAARAMLEVLESMRTTPPTDEELQLAKDSYLNSFVFNFDTPQEVVQRLMTYEYYGYPADFLEQIREGVQAVTAADVQRVAQAYLHPDGADILVLGRGDEFDEPLAVLAADGAVQEVDLTIPLAPPGEGAAAGGADGQERLMAVLDALGGAETFLESETLTLENVQRIQTPMGPAEIGSTLRTIYPDRILLETSTPQGDITFRLGQESAVAVTPMGAQEIPPEARGQVVGQVRGQLAGELPYLLLAARDLDVTLGASEEVDGQAADVLVFQSPSLPAPAQLYVDPETNRPLKLSVVQVGPQGPTPTEIVYTDYATFGGVTLPSAGTVYQSGEEVGTITYEDVTYGADLDPAIFEGN